MTIRMGKLSGLVVWEEVAQHTVETVEVKQAQVCL